MDFTDIFEQQCHEQDMQNYEKKKCFLAGSEDYESQSGVTGLISIPREANSPL